MTTTGERLAADLAGKIEKEVMLRLLERGFEEDLRQHPELPRLALLAEFDQYLVHERASAELYDRLVQRLASVTADSLAARPGFRGLDGCGVCAMKGWRSHE